MATQWCSLECCAYYVLGDFYKPKHNGTEEVELIKSMIKETWLEEKRNLYTLYPWWFMAGMPLSEYCVDYRRNADWYRYNNNNLLSKSLDNYIYY
jgi:hypothetical protein